MKYFILDNLFNCVFLKIIKKFTSKNSMLEWYEPQEDTYTLIDAIENENIENKVVIDMGCSTGAITKLLDKKNIVISVDLNSKALKNFSGSGNLIRTDLFKGIKQSEIDVCIFNPPYVPDFECEILGGGKNGRNVINKFINELDEIKTVYLLIIEANKPLEVIELFEKMSYFVEIIKIRDVIGEKLIILKAQKDFGRKFFKLKKQKDLSHN